MYSESYYFNVLNYTLCPSVYVCVSICYKYVDIHKLIECIKPLEVGVTSSWVTNFLGKATELRYFGKTFCTITHLTLSPFHKYILSNW